MSLRRSTRIRRAPAIYADLEPSYPDGPPANDFERMLRDLNKQAFPALQYGRVDDIIFLSLFGTKSRPNYRALDPVPVGEKREVTVSEARSIAQICARHFMEQQPASRDQSRQAVVDILKIHPSLFTTWDTSVLEQ